MPSKKAVAVWLLIGVFMIFIQVILGGITRLTGSGLSITRWEIVTGTLPPMNQAAWEEAFDLYKESPQYQQMNEGMSLSQFKQIYFWEWFHRLWARTMGFVFLLPFLWFLRKKYLDREYLIKTLAVFVLGGLVGVFGWLMVKSGLADRPMVSPYRLAVHLVLALATMGYAFWLALELLRGKQGSGMSRPLFRMSAWITGLLVVQVIFGALLSGMHGAMFYPTWPNMGGSFVPAALRDPGSWSLASFAHFDKELFPIAFVHFTHRMIAYLAVIVITWFLLRASRQPLAGAVRFMLWLIPLLLAAQVLLGIYTVLGSVGHIPVALGVLHQANGILLLFSFLYLNFLLRPSGSGPAKEQAFTAH